MNKQIHSCTFIAALIAVIALAGGRASAQDDFYFWNPRTSTTIDGETVYLWNEADNWDDENDAAKNAYPDAATARVRIYESTPSVLNANASFQDMSMGTSNADANVEIKSGKTLTFNDGVYAGSVGYDGKFDVYGTLKDEGGKGLRLGMKTDTDGNGKGILNLYDGGAFTSSSSSTLAVGGYKGDQYGLPYGGRGEVNIYGGDFQANELTFSYNYNEGADAPAGGVFNVAGSGATNIAVDADWWQNEEGTLQVGIDDGGVTPIQVGGDVRFTDGSLLDVSFLDGHEEYSSWTVMEWEWEETGLADLELDPSTGENWVLHKNTAGDGGNLTVQYVPEPSSLLLLGLAGLLLMKRRRA